VLTSRNLTSGWTLVRIVSACAVVALSGLTFTAAAPSAANADGMFYGGCVGWRGSFNCAGRWGAPVDPYIRLVPQQHSKEEIERAEARDRDWMARCKPEVANDRFGVQRYVYAARGCEYGAGNN
jgi:hypothetical protein